VFELILALTLLGNPDFDLGKYGPGGNIVQFKSKAECEAMAKELRANKELTTELAALAKGNGFNGFKFECRKV
jgi:hypothetical protein